MVGEKEFDANLRCHQEPAYQLSRVIELKPVPSRDLVLPVHPQEDNARGGALVIQLKICLRARFAQMNGQTVKSDHVLQSCPEIYV